MAEDKPKVEILKKNKDIQMQNRDILFEEISRLVPIIYPKAKNVENLSKKIIMNPNLKTKFIRDIHNHFNTRTKPLKNKLKELKAKKKLLKKNYGWLKRRKKVNEINKEINELKEKLKIFDYLKENINILSVRVQLCYKANSLQAFREMVDKKTKLEINDIPLKYRLDKKVRKKYKNNVPVLTKEQFEKYEFLLNKQKILMKARKKLSPSENKELVALKRKAYSSSTLDYITYLENAEKRVDKNNKPIPLEPFEKQILENIRNGTKDYEVDKLELLKIVDKDLKNLNEDQDELREVRLARAKDFPKWAEGGLVASILLGGASYLSMLLPRAIDSTSSFAGKAILGFVNTRVDPLSKIADAAVGTGSGVAKAREGTINKKIGEMETGANQGGSPYPHESMYSEAVEDKTHGRYDKAVLGIGAIGGAAMIVGSGLVLGGAALAVANILAVVGFGAYALSSGVETIQKIREANRQGWKKDNVLKVLGAFGKCVAGSLLCVAAIPLAVVTAKALAVVGGTLGIIGSAVGLAGAALALGGELFGRFKAWPWRKKKKYEKIKKENFGERFDKDKEALKVSKKKSMKVTEEIGAELLSEEQKNEAKKNANQNGENKKDYANELKNLANQNESDITVRRSARIGQLGLQNISQGRKKIKNTKSLKKIVVNHLNNPARTADAKDYKDVYGKNKFKAVNLDDKNNFKVVKTGKNGTHEVFECRNVEFNKNKKGKSQGVKNFEVKVLDNKEFDDKDAMYAIAPFQKLGYQKLNIKNWNDATKLAKVINNALLQGFELNIDEKSLNLLKEHNLNPDNHPDNLLVFKMPNESAMSKDVKDSLPKNSNELFEKFGMYYENQIPDKVEGLTQNTNGKTESKEQALLTMYQKGIENNENPKEIEAKTRQGAKKKPFESGRVKS